MLSLWVVQTRTHQIQDGGRPAALDRQLVSYIRMQTECACPGHCYTNMLQV